MNTDVVRMIVANAQFVVGREDDVVLEPNVLEAADPVEQDVVPVHGRHHKHDAVLPGPGLVPWRGHGPRSCGETAQDTWVGE